ncbi:hypothetical protein SteCoe_22872 [Stentor coeruleus]|uniref:Protein kinase domain-containing protein n=1 Tax=Stentor coeruleus TaxID=5963 RepID=A0A1R2BL77_9CILI|nr:hypothetical protein SteCoe_22872 [Stentor coeruleus]
MSLSSLIFIAQENLKTPQVESIAGSLIQSGSKSEYTEIYKYINCALEVQIYAVATLLIKINLDDPKLPESIYYIETCFWLVDILPAHKKIILGNLDSSIDKNIKVAQNEEHFLELAKHIKKLRTYDPSFTLALLSGGIRLRSGFTMRYSKEILKTNYTNINIISILKFLIYIQNCGFEINSSMMIVISAVMNFLEYRNKYVLQDAEVNSNIKEDYEILNLAKGFNLNNQYLNNRIQIIQGNLERKGNFNSNNKKIIDPVIQSKSFEDIYSKTQLKMIESGLTYKGTGPIFARMHNNFQVSVYLADYNGIDVAVKVYKKLKPEADLNRVFNECKCYQILSDKANPTYNAFLKYYGTFIIEDCVYLVMEHVENDLMYFLSSYKQNNTKITDLQILPLFYKLIASFAEMEELGIYHGDIKPHNMLVDNNRNIKIIDYSISVVSNRILTEGTTSGTHPLQGTIGYMAPEIVEGIKKGQKMGYFKMSKADVFSLGITFLQILTLESYTDYNSQENNKLLMEAVRKLPYAWAREMLKNMLNIDPNCRPHFNKLLVDISDVCTRTFSQ